MVTFKLRNKATSHSAEWVRRQITDRYVIQKQIDNYRSRAAYKLIELDDKYFIFKKNQTIVELGCYPGGWAQVALDRALCGASSSRVIGIDKIQIDPIPNYTFIKGDINDEITQSKLLATLDNAKADVVLSDLAPNCTGIKHDDHLNSAELCLQAGSLMERIIAVGGCFVVKIFMGSQLDNYKTYLRSLFSSVNSAKPKACRAESKEMYFVCRDFMGMRDIRGDVQTQGSFYPKEGRL
ncbi:ribosomal RNA methyltransferase, putative [Theileria equi strain WA]|uniref:rRNA methyltransferase 2, mitochondrial n=1 Tax=Theileria equi strain WA TaxID=1537102 RepID=L0B065_THEEQ|nr:ribosomal RNA methyltransferase, putative [Theileria equi strain WA]AFZ81215.1 ribosomal RNA methyltransferase, putative [Theileria equi strain WA]|eukprot:XP_004830881.1 ribosomal RNA methyltransferase, putative [Theileria equi strain WA]